MATWPLRVNVLRIYNIRKSIYQKVDIGFSDSWPTAEAIKLLSALCHDPQ
jgi:hypothetical protein